MLEEDREGGASRAAGSTKDASQSSPSASSVDNAAVDFLRRWPPSHRLGAIHPTKAFIGRDGRERSETEWSAQNLVHPAEAAQWLEQHQDWNLYWTPNECGEDRDEKPSEKDISLVHMLAVDLDRCKETGETREDALRETRALLTERLPEGVPPPTVIICTGNGHQGLWLLREPVKVLTFAPLGRRLR
ncbi:MAG: hypothetical protein R3F54_16970 [Alphaproteobacteria bacterium]